ncbi:MAG: hydrogenase nickel incorporation protein HypB [Bacteroidota bacterium]
MCETCGCGNKDEYRIVDPGSGEYRHDHNHMVHSHSHIHDSDHDHSHDHTHHERIDLNVDILLENNHAAALNRRFLEGRKVLCLNMVSSPGSGKTTILEKIISLLKSERKIYVIEGDQQTSMDADRIEKTGVPAIQINTGSGCHLDAKMIDAALKKMDIDANSILFIENVGNLVCPAMFDLGETRRVLVMSVTEGEDKPLKYPNMFETSHLCIINKTDLLPYVDFREDEFFKNALHINPHLELITLSARSGEGMNRLKDWITGLFF